MVKGLADIDAIWKRLKKAYGNTNLLLSKNEPSQQTGFGKKKSWKSAHVSSTFFAISFS